MCEAHNVGLRGNVAALAAIAIGFRLAGGSVASAQPSLNIPQPDETTPSFRAEQLFDTHPIDSVSIFTVDRQVTVPIGAEYPLSSGLKWSLSAHYSAKFWHSYQAACNSTSMECPGYPNYAPRAQVAGYSTIGVGWFMEMPFVEPDVYNPTTAGKFHGPDGGLHPFGGGPGPLYYTSDGSDLQVYRTPSGNWQVFRSDGTVYNLSHLYAQPTPANGIDFYNFDRDLGMTPPSSF